MIIVMIDPALSPEVAARALSQFPVEVANVEPLRRSDNLTWRVETRSGLVYLLRVHQSLNAVMAGARQRPDCIQSELNWLIALAESGHEVQHPLRAKSGRFVAQIEAHGRLTPCTLLSWVEGELFDENRHNRPEIARSYGSLTARLHNHAAAWTPPQDFIRPSQDAAHFERLFHQFKKALQWGLIQAEDWPILSQACAQIIRDVERYEDLPGQWGLIHADMHVGNILVRGARVLPIDFSLCGWGSFLFDASIALLGGLPAPLRPIFLQGYRALRPFAEELLPCVEVYALVGVLSYCSYQVENPDNHEWLVARIPRLVAGECKRDLNAEKIFALSSDLNTSDPMASL
jgi:Ser/Thr protein kinase RdoA (MazF antagonist)